LLGVNTCAGIKIKFLLSWLLDPNCN
jgi:hypothetical protein